MTQREITKLLNEYKAVQNGHGHIELLNADVRNAPPPGNPVNTQDVREAAKGDV